MSTDSAYIGVGLVGYGKIGRVHALSYAELAHYYPSGPRVRLIGVNARREEVGREAVAVAGFEYYTTTLDELLRDERVSVIDCCVPNFAHREVVEAALSHGKHVYCEKPLGLNAGEAWDLARLARGARQASQASQAAGRSIVNGVAFNYRFVPAVTAAKRLVEGGLIGSPYCFQFDYRHTSYVDGNVPVTWRLRKESSGGGALVDLGSHLIDMVRYLVGEVAEVFCEARTFIAERPAAREGSGPETEAVTVDDASYLILRTRSGAVGSLHVSRVSAGAMDDLEFEVWGSDGSLRFSLMEPNVLRAYSRIPRAAASFAGGLNGVCVLQTGQGFADAPAIPSPRATVGWTRFHTESQHQFLKAVAGRPGAGSHPTFEDAARAWDVVAAAYESSRTGRWIRPGAGAAAGPVAGAGAGAGGAALPDLPD